MKRTIVPRKSAFNRVLTQGESIEEKVRRVVDNNEPIEDTAPMIYTERKDAGVILCTIETKEIVGRNALQRFNLKNIQRKEVYF